MTDTEIQRQKKALIEAIQEERDNLDIGLSRLPEPKSFHDQEWDREYRFRMIQRYRERIAPLEYELARLANIEVIDGIWHIKPMELPARVYVEREIEAWKLNH